MLPFNRVSQNWLSHAPRREANFCLLCGHSVFRACPEIEETGDIILPGGEEVFEHMRIVKDGVLELS